MGRSRVRTSLLAAMVAATAVSATGVGFSRTAHAFSGTWTNPVLNTGTTITSNDAPDPYMYFDGTTYHAYTTGTQDKNGTWVNVPNYTSTDLVNWTYQGDALPDSAVPTAASGGWVKNSFHGFIWAPSILKRTNIYNVTYWVLYFTAPSNSYGKCIGAQVSYSLTGPFTGGSGNSPLECDTSFGQDYYDASPVVDYGQGGANPQAHLFWSTYHHIFADALGSNGYSRFGTGVQNVMTYSSGWQNTVVEGPSVVYDTTASRYVMFYSGNAWNTVNYAEGWATCTQNTYGVFTSCTDQTPAFALFSQNSGVKGPGGAEVFTDGSGQKWFVYHGFNASQCSGSTCSGSREMRIDKLTFSSGTPVTSAPTYTAQNF